MSIASSIKHRFKMLRVFKTFITEIIKKDFKLRYAQSYLGAIWIVLEPLLLVLTLSAIFTLIGRRAPDGMAFPVFFYSAVLIWNFFKSCLSSGTTAFICNKDLISKVHFPRWMSVLSTIGIDFFDFLFGNIAFVVIMIIYGVVPNIYYLLLPLFIIATGMIHFGMSMLLGSLNVFIRDVGKITKILATVWFWFTPIIFLFPFSGSTKIIYYINPMAGIVTWYRNIIALGKLSDPEMLYAAIAWIIVTNILGTITYKKLQRRFADVL